MKNEKEQLILQRTIMGWRMCIDYRKLNKAMRKDHFPLPFIDEMLERWDRFNGLIEQGPKLGFSGEVLLHTFYFSLTPECMQFVQMCAEGDLMEKTLTEDAQLLQKISKGAAMRRDWEKRCSASSSAGACWNF